MMGSLKLMANGAKWFAVSALLATLWSCGGGGGGGGSGAAVDPAVADAQARFGVSQDDTSYPTDGTGSGGGDGGGAGGSAGDGAPIRRATVLAIDSGGQIYSGLTDDKGDFLVVMGRPMVAPIVVKVIDPAGKVLTSVLTEGTTKGIFRRVMVNPLTDKIVSDSLRDGVAGTDKSFDGSKIDPSKVPAAVENLRLSVQAALSFAGVTTSATFNPITDVYRYNGEGVDAVIESITHKREPATGATQLAVKLTAASANTTTGVVSETFITASTPMATTQVVLNASAELTFEKLNALITEINFCASTVGDGTVEHIARCDQDRYFWSPNYKNSSMDFLEDFRTLFSDTGNMLVRGSVIKNPVILYTGQYAGSTATFNDLAVVELTIRQPRTGPLAGSISTPIEYPKYVVFRRDDTQTLSKAGNWVLHGNQRNFDLGAEARYTNVNNVNPLSNFNATGGSPSFMRSSIRIAIGPNKFNTATRLWESANIKAVRVTGPGLPAAGVVYAKTTVCGSTDQLYAIHNQSGFVSAGAMTTDLAQNDFRLNAVTPSGGPLYSGFWPSSVGTAGVSNSQASAIPALTDFSSLKAFNVYRYEVFLNTNATSTPDAVEFSRILAPVFPPEAALGFPLNDIAPSHPLITPGVDGYASGGNSFNVSWTNNLNSGPVFGAGLYAEHRNPLGSVPTVSGNKKWSYFANVSNAYSVNARPTSQTVEFDSGTQPDCGTGPVPRLGSGTIGDYREVSVSSRVSRSRIVNIAGWSNLFITTTVAFPAAAMPAVNSVQNYQVTATDTVSNTPITVTIKLSTSTAMVTALDGSSSTTTRVFHSGSNSIIQIGATTSAPSVATTVTFTYYALWNAPVSLWNFSANTTPAYVSAPGGTTIPIAYAFQDGFGNFWSGIINGTDFVGTHYVPFTGSTRGIPGSSYRFRATVIFQ